MKFATKSEYPEKPVFAFSLFCLHSKESPFCPAKTATTVYITGNLSLHHHKENWDFMLDLSYSLLPAPSKLPQRIKLAENPPVRRLRARAHFISSYDNSDSSVLLLNKQPIHGKMIVIDHLAILSPALFRALSNRQIHVWLYEKKEKICSHQGQRMRLLWLEFAHSLPHLELEPTRATVDDLSFQNPDVFMRPSSVCNWAGSSHIS